MKTPKLIIPLLLALLLCTACAAKRADSSAPLLSRVGGVVWAFDLDASAEVDDDARSLLEEFGDEARRGYADMGILINTEEQCVYYFDPSVDVEMKESYDVLRNDPQRAEVYLGGDIEPTVFTLEDGKLHMFSATGPSVVFFRK